MVGGVDVYLDEDKDAVAARNLHFIELHSRLAVHVDAVVRLLRPCQADAQLHGLLAGILHGKIACHRSDGGEHGVEHQRVGGELQLHIVTVAAMAPLKQRAAAHDEQYQYAVKKRECFEK